MTNTELKLRCYELASHDNSALQISNPSNGESTLERAKLLYKWIKSE